MIQTFKPNTTKMLVALAVATWSLSAFAQEQRLILEPPRILMQLNFLSKPEFLKELKLSEQQIKGAGDLKKSLRDAMSERLGLHGGGSIDDLKEEYQASCDELVKEFEPKFLAILSEQQGSALFTWSFKLPPPVFFWIMKSQRVSSSPTIRKPVSKEFATIRRRNWASWQWTSLRRGGVG